MTTHVPLILKNDKCSDLNSKIPGPHEFEYFDTAQLAAENRAKIREKSKKSKTLKLLNGSRSELDEMKLGPIFHRKWAPRDSALSRIKTNIYYDFTKSLDHFQIACGDNFPLFYYGNGLRVKLTR